MKRKLNTNILSLLYAALGAALMAVSSMISIPIVIPITLQTLALYILLFFFGGKIGTLAATIYVAIGAVGLPVFSGFGGGVGRLFDASGGFIFGFIFAAAVFWLMSTVLGSAPRAKILSGVASLLVLYLVGTLWYSLVYLGGGGFFAVISACVLPFIIPDAVKMFFAYAISSRLGRIIPDKTKSNES